LEQELEALYAASPVGGTRPAPSSSVPVIVFSGTGRLPGLAGPPSAQPEPVLLQY
jgi:hypothetical protein